MGRRDDARDSKPLEADFARFRNHGDVEAMGRVFDAAAPKLMLIAAHLGENTADCEDLLQATFLAALTDRDAWDESKPLMPWLTSILGHRAIDARRKRDVRQSEPFSDRAVSDLTDLDPAELSADREHAALVANAIDQLPSAHREVLLLRVVHGLEPTEIAHTLGRSPGTVRAQISRGREQLRRRLPDDLRALAALSLATPPSLEPARAAVMEESTRVASTLSGAAAAGTSPAWMLMNGKLVLACVALIAAVGWATFHISTDAARPRPDVERAGGGSRSAIDLASLDTELASKPARVPANQGRSEETTQAAALAVSVVTSSGTSLTNCGVYLHGEPLGVLGQAKNTDAQGVARFERVPNGAYEVLIDRAASVRREVDVDGDTAISIRLPAGLDVAGQVVDLEPDGVAGARVLRLDPAHHDGAIEVAVSGEGGNFHITQISPDSKLIARADGYQPSNSGRPGRVYGPRVMLELGAVGHRLHGQVVDPGGHAVPFASIVVAVDEDARDEPQGSAFRSRENVHGKPWDTELFQLRADEEGRFDTREIPHSSLSLFAQSPQAPELVGAVTLDFAGDLEQPMELRLGQGGQVRGRVSTQSGAPIPGMRVRSEFQGSAELGGLESGYGIAFVDRATTTAADGSFRLVGLMPGSHRLDAGGGRRGLTSVDVDLDAGQSFDWSPKLAVDDHLRVRVLDSEGEPLPGYAVAVNSVAWSTRVSGLEDYTTNAEGRCTVGRLYPGQQRVAVFAPNGRGRFDRIPLHVTEVTPMGTEVEVRVVNPTASVRGTLAAAGAATEARQRPKAELTRVGMEGGQDRHVGADGSFHFDGLAAGEYVLRFVDGAARYSEEIEAARFHLASGQDLDLGTLNPDPGTTVVFELLLAEGDDVDDLRVLLTPHDRPQGWRGFTRRIEGTLRFETTSLGPGRYAVSTLGPGVVIQSWSIQVGPQHALRDPATGALVQAEVLQLVGGHPVAFDVHFAPPPTGPSIRPRGKDGTGRVDLSVDDATGHCIERDRVELELNDVRGRVMRIERRFAPGTYWIKLEDERFDGWEKPRTRFELEVPPQGLDAPISVDLRAQ